MPTRVRRRYRTRQSGGSTSSATLNEVYSEWKRLVVAYSVMGVQAHDARLVAAMKVYGIERILTFNVQDFLRYKEIEAVRPS